MNRRITVCLLLLVHPIFSFAQDAGTEKAKIIKWPLYYKAKFPSDAPAVAAITVLPFTWDRERLGYVQKGMANAYASAVPQQPLPQFLQAYIQKQYAADYKGDGVHLLWLVNDLRISERTFFSSEYAFAKLKADVYMSEDSNTYRRISRFDTVIRRGGLDVTNMHGQVMAETFHILLKQTLEKLPTAMATTPTEVYTKKQIIEKKLALRSQPVLQVQSYNEGIYTNFEEFLQNDPAITQFSVINNDGDSRLYAMHSDGDSSLVKNAWGLSIGDELYHLAGGALIPLEREGDGFIISTYRDAVRRRNKSMFTGAMIGGALGGAIGGAIGAAAARNDRGIYTVTSMPYLGKKVPEARAIDMETGALTF